MKFKLLLAASFVLGSSTALAQGLPGLQKQVDALEAQVKALLAKDVTLQSQIDTLQTQIISLRGQIPQDDGTALALVGTWKGPDNSLEFESSQFQLFFSLNGLPSPFVSVPRTGGGFDQYGVNPAILLPRNGAPNNIITFTIARDPKLGMHLTGMATSTDQPNPSITLRGVALSNGFFLLRAFVQSSGSCAPTIYQAVGALNLTGTVMTVIGSGVDASCRHSVFRLQLTKQTP